MLDSVGVPLLRKHRDQRACIFIFRFAAKYTEQSKEFARVIVKLVYAQIPSFTSIERATRLRKGKIVPGLPCPGDPCCVPMSSEAKAGATVSASWDEVKPGL